MSPSPQREILHFAPPWGLKQAFPCSSRFFLQHLGQFKDLPPDPQKL